MYMLLTYMVMSWVSIYIITREWVSDEFDVDLWTEGTLNMKDDSNSSFILEVDLEYPKELHVIIKIYY